MINSDVLVLMKKLSPKEIKELTIYLKKQFQKGSIPLRLFLFLKKYYPDFAHKKLSFEYVYELLFPATNFNKKIVQNTLSDLRIVIRDFLVGQYLKDNALEKEILLLRVYSQRQLDSHFEKQYKSIKKAIGNKPQQDMWFWLNHIQLEHEKYFNIGTKRMIERGSIFKAMESLDQFYAAAKLKYASEVISGYNLCNEKDPSVRFLKDIEVADWCSDFTCHTIYKKVLALVRGRTTSAYFKLKDYFFEHFQDLYPDDQTSVLTYLLNHASTEVRRGNDDFNLESFELMKFGLLQGFFIVDGVLHPGYFLNIVTVASRVEHFEWAKDFVKKYAKMLSPNNRIYYSKYCQALINFYQKDYKNCAKLLEGIELKEPQDQYRGRWLKIIVDYETSGFTEILDKKVEAFYQFVRRNKVIPEEKKEAMLLTYKVFKKLMDPNTTKAKLENLLEHSSHFYYKNWMDEKIRLLK